MNSAVACSSVMRRTEPSLPAGKRMKRSILPGMRISAFIALPSDTQRQMQRDGEAETWNERERMGRVDRQRRQQRENIVKEVIFDPGAFGFGDVLAVDQNDADFGERSCEDRARSPAGRSQASRRSR